MPYLDKATPGPMKAKHGRRAECCVWAMGGARAI